VLGKAVLAEFGALHPRVLAAHDLTAAAGAEVFLDALPPRRRAARGGYAPPALQAVRRDFAFLYPADAPADALLRVVAGADKALVVGVSVFDRFAGTGVPEGMVSLGVEVVLQPRDTTLAESDLAALSARIVAAAAKVGASLRA
jgi:phenylalanyl-tRNA synthetase beta chain